MSRRPPPRRRREFSREEGPFDRVLRTGRERDPAPLIIGGTIIFLAVLILILVLPPLSLLGGGGGDGQVGEPQEVGCGITARVQGDLPNLPEGLVSLSALYQMNVPPEAKEQGCLVTTISLTTPTQDSANLGFYTYEDGNWRRLAAATLAEDGAAAEAQLTDIPVNMAVLRLATARFEAIGSIPSGATVDPSLAGLLAIISPRDYAPAADGSVTGTATALPEGQNLKVFPTIAAVDGEAAAAVGTILSDPGRIQSHIEAIVDLAEAGKYDGHRHRLPPGGRGRGQRVQPVRGHAGSGAAQGGSQPQRHAARAGSTGQHRRSRAATTGRRWARRPTRSSCWQKSISRPTARAWAVSCATPPASSSRPSSTW